MGLQDQQWYNLNANRQYPIDETATGLSDDGDALPSVLLADCILRFPNTIGQFAYLSAVLVGPHLVTLCFSASNEHPGLSSLVVPDEEPSNALLATLTLQKPVDEARHYVLQAEQDGVAGWVVFGSDLQGLNYRGTFSTSAQSALLVRCGRSYQPPGVTSLGKSGLAASLTGLIKLHTGSDMRIVKQEVAIDGIGDAVEAICVGLQTSLDYDVFDRYRGQCSGRPESDTCRQMPLTSIAGVPFDCDGNLTLNITGASVTELAGYGLDAEPTDALGLVIDFAMGFEQTCARNKGLPDADGTLPATYSDFCAISSSVIANYSSLVEPGNSSLTEEWADACCYSFDNYAVAEPDLDDINYGRIWPKFDSPLSLMRQINDDFSAVVHPISGGLCAKSMRLDRDSIAGGHGYCLDNSDPTAISVAVQAEITFLRPAPYRGNPSLGIADYVVQNNGGVRLIQASTAWTVTDSIGAKLIQWDGAGTYGSYYHTTLRYGILLDLNKDSLRVDFDNIRHTPTLFYTNGHAAYQIQGGVGGFYTDSPSYISPLSWVDLDGKTYGPLGLKPNHRYVLQVQYKQVYTPGPDERAGATTNIYPTDLYYGKVYARIIDRDPDTPGVDPVYVNPGGVVIDYSAGLEVWPYQFNSPPIFTLYQGRVVNYRDLHPGCGFFAKGSQTLFDNYCVKNSYTELHYE